MIRVQTNKTTCEKSLELIAENEDKVTPLFKGESIDLFELIGDDGVKKLILNSASGESLLIELT